MIIAPITGSVNWTVRSFGSTRVRLEGEIVDSTSPEETRRVEMIAGQRFPLFFVMSKRYTSDSFGVTLLWEYEGQPKQVIPASAYLQPTSAIVSRNLTVL